MKSVIYSSVLCLFCHLSFGQATVLWSEVFESNESHYFMNEPDLQIEGDSIKVSGRVTAIEGSRLQIVYYDLFGDTISTIQLGKDSVGLNEIADYKIDAFNNIYVFQRDYLEYYKSRYVLQKYNEDGDLIWVQILQHAADTSYKPASLDLINDTTIFVSFYKEFDYPIGPGDIVSTQNIPEISSYHSNGTLNWNHEFNPTTELSFFSDAILQEYIGIVTLNDTVYIFGSNYSTDYCMLKLALDGTLSVVNDLNTENGCSKLYVTLDGNLLVVAGPKYRLTKLNSLGNDIWINYYGTNLPSNVSGDEISELIQDSSGNLYVTGRHYGDDYGTSSYSNADILTIKYDPTGNIIWENRFEYGENYNNADIGETIFLKDGFVYVGGSSQEYGQGTGLDYIILKIDSADGQLAGGYRFDAPYGGNDVVSDLAVLDNGEIVLTGFTQSGAAYEWTTQLITDIQLSIEANSYSTSPLIYPNPATINGILSVELAAPTEFQLLNVSGKLIREGSLNQNEHQIDLNGISSGYYILRIRQDGETMAIPLVIH